MDMFTRCTLIRDCALPANLKIVLHELNWHQGANEDCFPSIDRLGSKTGLPRRTVQLCLRQLRDAGLLSVQKRRRASTYLVDWTKLQTRSNGASTESRGAVTAPMTRSSCADEAQLLRPNNTTKNTTNSHEGAKQLVADFHTAFLGSTMIATMSELHAAAQLVATHGLDRCLAALPSVASAMKQQFPAARTFAASVRYFETAITRQTAAAAKSAAERQAAAARRKLSAEAKLMAEAERAAAAAHEQQFRQLPEGEQMRWLRKAGYRPGGHAPLELCLPIAIHKWRESQ